MLPKIEPLIVMFLSAVKYKVVSEPEPLVIVMPEFNIISPVVPAVKPYVDPNEFELVAIVTSAVFNAVPIVLPIACVLIIYS